MLDTGNQVAQIAGGRGSVHRPGEGPGFVEVRNGTNVSRRPLDQPRLVVGRAPESQIHLDNASVSRQHAELTRDPFGRWWVRDLASRNGTFVNGQRVTERVLAAGDIVQVGACSLVLQSSPTSVGSTAPGRGMRSGVFGPEVDVSTISTLRDVQPPRLAASHLNTLTGLSQDLLGTPDPVGRCEAICRLMVSHEFHARSAVVLRVSKADPDAPPQLLCEPHHAVSCLFPGPSSPPSRAAGAAGPGTPAETPYVSRSLLRAVRSTGEPSMASNLSNGSAGGPQGPSAIEMSIAPSLMTVAAVACPVHDDGASTDLLYAILPPQYGTGEWLALASLAAKQYQQAEQVWRARAQSEEHAALERELQRARQIQMRLVPKNPVVPGLELAVGFSPCRWVGGDYVDVARMDDGRTLLTVADVCGKGLAAALVSSSLHTMVHGSLSAGGTDVLRMMQSLSAYLTTAMSDDSFVTMVALAIDPATGAIECVNAGHPPPLLIEPGGQIRSFAAGKNLPLGCDPTEVLEGESAEMPPGSVLALYTDGLTEQRDESGEMLEIEGLRGWLSEVFASPGISTAAAADALHQRCEALRGKRIADDDRTFLLARRL
jgi:phosphoserine phosphatase RsbU/P